MTDTRTDLDLEALIDARLAAMGLVVPAPSPQVAQDPDGTPGNVASGELIESAWGNAVTSNVDALYKALPQGPGPYVGGWPAGGWPVGGRAWRAGHTAVNTSGFGDGSVTFAPAFPNGVISVMAIANQVDKSIFWWPQISATFLTGFSFFAISQNGHPYATGHPPGFANVWTVVGTVTIDYIAFGA